MTKTIETIVEEAEDKKTSHSFLNRAPRNTNSSDVFKMKVKNIEDSN